MAQSRLEKIGTIYTRVAGLLKSGAMKSEDKPIWYDIYAAFPPKLEPRFDRPAPNLPIRNIFYEEDLVRAKFHKSEKQLSTINLVDRQQETPTQQFIGIYQELKSQGAVDDNQVFDTARELLQEKRLQMKPNVREISLITDEEDPSKVDMNELFKKTPETETKQIVTNAKKTVTPQSEGKHTIGGIDVKNLFKD